MEARAGADSDAVALFRRWRQLAGLYALRKKLPRSNADLFEVFRADTLPVAIERLVLATAWDRSAVAAFLGPDGLAIDSPAGLRPTPEQADEPTLLRLARAIEVQRRAGVGAGDAVRLGERHSRCRRRGGDRPGGEGALRRAPAGSKSRSPSTIRSAPSAGTRWSPTCSRACAISASRIAISSSSTSSST